MRLTTAVRAALGKTAVNGNGQVAVAALARMMQELLGPHPARPDGEES